MNRWEQDANGAWWWINDAGHKEGPYYGPNNYDASNRMPGFSYWVQDNSGQWYTASSPAGGPNSATRYSGPGGAAVAPSQSPAPSPPPTTGNPQPTVQPVPQGSTGVPAQESGKALFQGQLDTYGLSQLGDWAWKRYQETGSWDQVFLELRQRPEYAARFPGMAALQQKGHAITEGQYVDLERQYTSLARQAGLPTGMYDDPTDFAKLIAGEVSPTEYGRRLDVYSNLIYTADPSAKQFLKQYYGIDEGGILAYAIDPTKALPILTKQFLAAQESAAAVRAGFGGLSKTEAEQVANWGIDPSQAASQFLKLGLDQQLFQALPGEADQTAINRDTAIAGYLGGNAQAVQAVERRRTSRLGEFSGGGGYVSTSKGVVGVGAEQR